MKKKTIAREWGGGGNVVSGYLTSRVKLHKLKEQFLLETNFHSYSVVGTLLIRQYMIIGRMKDKLWDEGQK